MYPFPGYQVGWARKNSPSRYTTVPPRITSFGKIARCPSKGVQPHLLCRISGSTVTAERGYSAKSARSPGAKPDGGMPMSAAGTVAVFRIRSGRVILRSSTSAISRGTMVSTPGIPEGARGNGSAFSSTVWGA